MSVRTFITAICVAGFVAGPAATQAQASVPPSALATGSAVVGADVRALPALALLPGTFNWWLSLSHGDTTSSYSRLAVSGAMPVANAYDSRNVSVELSPTVDSVDASSSYTGWRTWQAGITNMSTLTVPAPQISVDQSSLTFTPTVTFPLSSPVGADITAQYQSFNFDPLSGRSYGNSQVDGVPISTGFDLTRTVSPATIPAEGGTQDVTITVIPRDPSYAHMPMSLVVQADAGLPPSGRPATIVAGSVTTDSAGQSEPAPYVYSDYVGWYPYELVVGRTYTLTLTIAVSGGTGFAFPYKPYVMASISNAQSLIAAVGRSVTVADNVLGGTFTYSAGADVNWSLYSQDFRIAILDPINPPQLPYVYTYINNYNVASEPADVDSVAAGTSVSGLVTWSASMCNTTPDALPTPSISVDQSSQTFTPLVSFPVGTAPQTSLAGNNGCLSLSRLAGGSPNSSVAGVPTSTGYDVSRTMSPETIAPGGDTQTVHVSITPRDSRYEQVFLEVTTGAVQGAQIDTSSVVWPTLGAGEQAVGTVTQPAYVIQSINNPVVGKTYTLTLQIHVPNSTSVSRTYKPGIYIGGGLHVNVDASGPPPNGASTSVHDDVLGGTFTFSLGTPARWTHNLWRQYALSIDSLWSGAPNGHIGVYRTTQVAPDASSDSVDGTQTLPGTLSWTAYIWNYGSDAITSPTISLDASSQTFTPPVTFPLSTTGGNLQHYDTLWLDQLDGYTGHSQVDVNGLTTGLDATRTMTPRAIPPGGGTQTVTVSITVRDPQTAGGSVSIDVTPGDLVLGAVVDPSSVVWPTADPNASPYTYIAPDGSDAYWSLPTSTLNKTYNLTLQIHVPNGTATALQYKPKVTAEAALPAVHLPSAWGDTTTITDNVLGGTFTFSARTNVDWSSRIQIAYTDIFLAPLAAADTTPPVLSSLADKTVDATGSTGAAVAFTVTATDNLDPSPTVVCTPASGSVFPVGTTTVNCTATDVSGNTAHGSFTITVTAAPSSGGGGGGSGGGGGGGSGVADLRLEGSVEPTQAAVGENLTWRITVNDYNTGPATNFWVDIQFPASVSLVSSYADRGTGCTVVGDNKLHCYLDWLADNVQFGHVILVTKVTATGDHVLTAVTGYSAADPTPADNTLTLTATTPAPPPPYTPPVVVVRPVIGSATITPAAAAGRHVAVSFKVTRSDNGKLLTRGTMICDPSIQGRVIHHAEQFTNGVARLAFTIPKNAKGKLLKVHVTIKLAGQSATRIVTFHVK